MTGNILGHQSARFSNSRGRPWHTAQGRQSSCLSSCSRRGSVLKGQVHSRWNGGQMRCGGRGLWVSGEGCEAALGGLSVRHLIVGVGVWGQSGERTAWGQRPDMTRHGQSR